MGAGNTRYTREEEGMNGFSKHAWGTIQVAIPFLSLFPNKNTLLSSTLNAQQNTPSCADPHHHTAPGCNGKTPKRYSMGV